MLWQLDMVGMRRRSEAGEDDWDSTSHRLGTIEGRRGRHKESLLGVWVGYGARLPGDDCRAVEQDLY